MTNDKKRSKDQQSAESHEKKMEGLIIHFHEMQATVLTFESHPHRELHLWLFKDVTNSKEIGERIINKELPREFSFINAAFVPSVFVVHLCASKALFAESSKSLRCRTLHGELIVNLSGSKHIASSLKKYGASDDAKHFIVAAFDPSESDVAFLKDFVKGTPTDISELETLCDIQLIKKSFKIAAPELQIGTLSDAIACRVAAHDLDKT